VNKYLLIFALIALVAVAGCPQQAASSVGNLQLKITDQAQNITSLDITFSKASVHLAHTDETDKIQAKPPDVTTDGAIVPSEESGWTDILTSPRTVDLVDVKGLLDLLGEDNLPAGKYTQIRLYVSSAEAVIDNNSVTLEVPSGAINFVHPFILSANTTTSLIFDFDADTSIVSTGSGKYLFKPVVRMKTEFADKNKGEAESLKNDQVNAAKRTREQRLAEKNRPSTPQPVEQPTETPTGEFHKINIYAYVYYPTTIFMKAGDSIMWYNMDPANHTVTSNDGLFDSGTLQTGQSFNLTFKEVGTYHYYDSLHKWVIGTLFVE
jgi:plastocyanin